ncbi:MAG: nucleotide exchange factor GrpE [Candidatus Saccharimonadales bacterium]
MKTSKPNEHEQKIIELTQDLQRLQADFENYRKRVESEKEMARAQGKITTINALLPIVDNIERSIKYRPKDLEGNVWADGVSSLVKNLEKSLTSLNLTRIEASKGAEFNHELHEAVQFDENKEGEHEVIAEELQAGYKLGNDVIRPAIVKVTRR